MKYNYKYMRTKNGISEIRSKMIFNSVKEYVLGNTIEELCDEFVIKHIKYEKTFVADDYRILEDRQKAFEYGVEVVYGAIYTSKGLIYVAKMDDEGKLVLI